MMSAEEINLSLLDLAVNFVHPEWSDGVDLTLSVARKFRDFVWNVDLLLEEDLLEDEGEDETRL